jgi:hypothetical protein
VAKQNKQQGGAMFRRRGAYINGDSGEEYLGTEYEEDDSSQCDYLSDILVVQRQIEESMNELINQGDKQVEFLSRLVTLFEGLARNV